MGFTIVKNTITFSPVKTNLVDARVKSKEGMPTYSAASGEADAYLSGCEMLAAAGVTIAPPNEVSMAGVRVSLGARVVIDPTFGIGVAAWREKLPTPKAVRMSNRSTPLLQGELRGLRIESLDLDGTLVLRMCEGANVTLRKVRVANTGWAFKSLWGRGHDEAIAIRGYNLAKHAQRELIFDRPGVYVIEDPEAETCSVA